MEKYRRRSLLEICFVLLYIGNCILLVISVLHNNLVFAASAIFLSVLQIILFKQFQKKADIWKQFSFSGMIRYLFRLHNPFSSIKEIETGLTNSDKILVRKRSKNLNTGIIYHAPLRNDGSYEYLAHFKTGHKQAECSLRVQIGQAQCAKPYSLSILNLSASSLNSVGDGYAFSLGAKLAQCALATGLKGLQPEHIRGGGDLIWQYRLPFSAIKDFDQSDEAIFFRRNSCRPYIKMIEFSITGTEKYKYGMWVDEYNKVSFEKGYGRWENNPEDLSEILICLSKLRSLCEGKPVGIRLELKNQDEVIALCRAINQTSIIPDFITIDHHSGYFILACAKTQLEKSGINTALLYSGPVITELDILKTIAIGASACITTAQVSHIFPRVSMFDKSTLVANLHRNTIAATQNFMGLCQYKSLKEIKALNFYHKSPIYGLVTLEDLYFPQNTPNQFPLVFNN